MMEDSQDSEPDSRAFDSIQGQEIDEFTLTRKIGAICSFLEQRKGLFE